jgi:hypothetical protein
VFECLVWRWTLHFDTVEDLWGAPFSEKRVFLLPCFHNISVGSDQFAMQIVRQRSNFHIPIQ